MNIHRFNNCIYLHTPKTGGTTFLDHFGFEKKNHFSQRLDAMTLDGKNGNLVHMHVPDISLEAYCDMNSIDFEQVLQDTVFVSTLRDPCAWIESYWNFIIQKRLDFPHLLLPETQFGVLNGIVNPLNFDESIGTINGISIDQYVEKFENMREATFFEIVKVITSTLWWYPTLGSFYRHHLNPVRLPQLLNGVFDVSPYQGYSALSYIVKSYLFKESLNVSDSVLGKLNLVVIPTSRLTTFLSASKDSNKKYFFEQLGLDALFAKANVDFSPAKMSNVHGPEKRFLLTQKSRDIINSNMSKDVWNLRALELLFDEHFG